MIMRIETQIKHYKERLIRKAKRIGLWENFGQEEVNVLRDAYYDYKYKSDGVWDAIMAFDNWCKNLDIEGLKNENIK